MTIFCNHQYRFIPPILLGVAVLSMTGCSLWQQQQNPIQVPTATSTVETATTTIDTSTWKTYRNEEYGFEFKYPGEWKVEEFSRGQPKFDPTDSLLTIFFYENLIDDSLVLFVTINQVNKSTGDNGHDSILDNFIGDIDEWKKEKIVISGTSTYVYSSNEYSRRIAPLLLGNELVTFYSTRTSNNQDMATFKIILATLIPD